MAEQDRSTLKEYFGTGNKPTSEQFDNLIDSGINKIDNKIAGNFVSIADLRLFDGSGLQDGQWINVNGYYGSDTGGGGVFYWDSESTAADNNFTIIKLDSVGIGRFIRINNSAVPATQQDLGGKTNDSSFESANIFNKRFNTVVSGGSAQLKELKIVGVNFFTPGLAVADQFSSCVLMGRGVGFIDKILPKTSDAGPLITIDGTTNVAFDSIIEKLGFFPDEPNQGGIYFKGDVNVLTIRDLTFRDITTGGYAMSMPEDIDLFQDMYFQRIQVNSNGTRPVGSRLIEMYPTGNVEFLQPNIENVETGIFARYQRTSTLGITQAQIERTKYALDVDGCVVNASFQASTGGIYLGSGCWGGEINIEKNNVSSNLLNGICDTGIGNKIRINGTYERNTGDAVSGIELDGDEWLFANQIDDNPLFNKGAGNQVVNYVNASPASRNVNVKGLKNSQSVNFVASANGGYREKIYTIDTDKEYLFQAGGIYYQDSNNNVSFEFYDGDDNLIFDSGVIEKYNPSRSGEIRYIFRKLLPANATGTLKVRAVAKTSGDQINLAFSMLNKSEAVQADITGEDSTTGTGVNLVYNANLNSTEIVLETGESLSGMAFLRFRANCDSDGAYVSAFRSTDQDNAYGAYPLHTGDREYVIPLLDYPSTGRIEFHAFSSVNIELSEVSLHQFPVEKTLSANGGKVKGGTEFEGNHTQIGDHIVTGERSYSGNIIQKNQGKALGDIGATTGSPTTLLSLNLPTNDCAAVVDVEVISPSSRNYIGKVLIRKSGGSIVDKIVDEQRNPSGTITITATEVDSSNIDIVVSSSAGTASSYGFYDLKTINQVTATH